MPGIRASRCFVHAIAALALCCGHANALNRSLDVSQYARTTWSVRDGFPSGAVFAIAQSPDGYLWLGTEFGVIRFDGARSVAWQPPAGEQLPSDNVHALLFARDGGMWIGTAAGLARWDGKALTRYPEHSGRFVSSIAEDGQGTIWVGSNLRGSPARICSIRSHTTECFGDDGSLGTVARVYVDRAGKVWFTTTRGLWRWAPGPPRLFTPDAGPAVGPVTDDDGKLVVVVASSSVRLFADERFGTELLSAPGTTISRALRDRDGALWVGTNAGLFHVRDGRTDSYTRQDGFPDDAVSALFEDREGNVWAATANGLHRFREYAIPAIGDKQGVHGGATAVETTHDGTLWMATTRGLYRLRDGAITTDQIAVSRNSTAQRPPPIESANALHVDRRGRLWIANRHGVFCVDGERARAVNTLGDVLAMADDGDGTMWFARFGGPLSRIRLGGDTAAATENLQGGIAVSVLADPGDGVWVGFRDGGVGFLKDGDLHRLPGIGEGGRSDAAVWDLYLDRQHTLWAATQRGLVRIKDGRAATLTSKQGLPCDAVHWIIEDDAHSFWMGLACGVARVKSDELAAWSTAPNRNVRLETFGREDGVINGAIAYGGGHRVAKTADGKLYFHSSDGFGVIDPAHIPGNMLPPPIKVEEFVVDGKTYDSNTRVELPPLVRDLEIRYTALSFVAPEKNRFRYKLEGRDKDWQPVTDRRRAVYTDLAPGTYRFRVMGSNNDGVWNEQGDTLDFVIAPAWWQTRWFQVGCVAAALLFIWAVYLLRVRQLRRRFTATLDARVQERTRIARELHDTLLQSFQSLLPRLQAAYELLPARVAEAKHLLGGSIDRASEAIAEGRQAVHDLRDSTSEMNDLAVAIRTLGETLVSENAARPVDVRVEVQGAPRDLHPILRDEIFRIAGEALRNAFRHAEASRIEVEVRYEPRRFQLRIRDDGRGMDPGILVRDGREGHFGLRGMRERAKLIGGKLTIWSAEESGTEVDLVIPASHAYSALPAPIRESFVTEKAQDT